MAEVKLAKMAIVGLGNPGDKYKKTYHNAGLMFIDYLLRELRNSGELKTGKLRSSHFFKPADYKGLILVKSNVFMNESGQALQDCLKYFKLKPAELYVAHDDSDIELGQYKISFGRGSAGHKGVQSIIDALGTKNFWRLRMGIKGKTQRKQKAQDIVLKNIPQKQLKILFKVFKDIYEKVLK